MLLHATCPSKEPFLPSVDPAACLRRLAWVMQSTWRGTELVCVEQLMNVTAIRCCVSLCLVFVWFQDVCPVERCFVNKWDSGPKVFWQNWTSTAENWPNRPLCLSARSLDNKHLAIQRILFLQSSNSGFRPLAGFSCHPSYLVLIWKQPALYHSLVSYALVLCCLPLAGHVGSLCRYPIRLVVCICSAVCLFSCFA